MDDTRPSKPRALDASREREEPLASPPTPRTPSSPGVHQFYKLAMQYYGNSQIIQSAFQQLSIVDPPEELQRALYQGCEGLFKTQTVYKLLGEQDFSSDQWDPGSLAEMTSDEIQIRQFEAGYPPVDLSELASPFHHASQLSRIPYPDALSSPTPSSKTPSLIIAGSSGSSATLSPACSAPSPRSCSSTSNSDQTSPPRLARFAYAQLESAEEWPIISDDFRALHPPGVLRNIPGTEPCATGTAFAPPQDFANGFFYNSGGPCATYEEAYATQSPHGQNENFAILDPLDLSWIFFHPHPHDPPQTDVAYAPNTGGGFQETFSSDPLYGLPISTSRRSFLFDGVLTMTGPNDPIFVVEDSNGESQLTTGLTASSSSTRTAFSSSPFCPSLVSTPSSSPSSSPGRGSNDGGLQKRGASVIPAVMTDFALASPGAASQSFTPASSPETRRFPCTRKCGRTFNRPSDVTRHLQTACTRAPPSILSPRTCGWCGKLQARGDGVRRHQNEGYCGADPDKNLKTAERKSRKAYKEKGKGLGRNLVL